MWETCISNTIRALSQKRIFLCKSREEQDTAAGPDPAFLAHPTLETSSMARETSISAVTCQCFVETGKLAYSCIPRLAEGFEQYVETQ